ncbi:hypothetical protein OAQ53_02105 [Gammaproteobacteria bacterium]|nr:hypothetical protein [Gammaproteobacteria bacterium]
MISVIKKSPVVIHQLFFLFAQLMILQIHGIGYSGTLAYVGVVSTFLAVMVNLKWDIEIMVNNHLELHESLLDSSITIFLMAFVVIFFNLIIGSPLPVYIIFSAIIIAIHELLVSILFVQKKIYRYSFFRTIPAIALILFALVDLEAEIIWPASFFISVIFLLIYFRTLLKKAILGMNIIRIKKIKFLHKFYAAITASTFSFFSAFFVIVINFYYGSDYVGLWSNTIRIFNSVLIFLLGASLPFVLNMIRDKKTNSEKVKMFLYLWILFCPLIILSIFITLNWGEFILSFFITYDFEVSNIYLSYIVLIAVAISFVGSSQGLYQGINKSVFLLVMIFVSAIVGLIYFFNDLPSFISLLEVFLISIFTLVMMVLAHLLSVLVYRTYGSRD